MDIKKFFAERLYNNSGMMCDPAFVGFMYDEMVEVFDIEDLDCAGLSFDVEYDGSFEVMMDDFRLNGKDYLVFRVYPLMDDKETVLGNCVCGEAWILHTAWEQLVTELEKLDD